MVATIIFEEGLGGFIPIEKVSDIDLTKAIQELADEANKRKMRLKAARQVILFTSSKDIGTYFPETRNMSSDIDRDKYFIRALNLHLKKMQENGQTIISVAYVSGAYAEEKALICYEEMETKA